MTTKDEMLATPKAAEPRPATPNKLCKLHVRLKPPEAKTVATDVATVGVHDKS